MTRIKYLDSELKYAPKGINDFIFANPKMESKVIAYCSGQLTRPIILSGSNGTGKSLLSRLIPRAIENMDEVATFTIKASDLVSDSAVSNIYTKNKQFDHFFTFNGQKYSYYIIEEMNGIIKGRDAFQLALDHYKGTDLTIITTNNVNRIAPGIISRCEVIDVPPCAPNVFFIHAKKILTAEGVDIDDTALMTALEASYNKSPDNRSYYKLIDQLFRTYQQRLNSSQFQHIQVTSTVATNATNGVTP